MKRLLLILVICCFAAPVGAAKKKAEPAAPQKFTMKEVQAGVMSFADSWSGMTTQATNYLVNNTNTPEASLQVKQFQFYLAHHQ